MPLKTLLLLVVGVLILVACQNAPAEPAIIRVVAVEFTATPPRPTSTAHPTPTATATPPKTSSANSKPVLPTPTSTPVVVRTPTLSPTPNPINGEATAAAQLQDTLQSLRVREPVRAFEQGDKVALAHYFAWFNIENWNDCNITPGDKPNPLYDSDDPQAILRHVQLATSIGLDGFTLHWFAPGDPTDRNFRTLLDQSTGYPFASTVVYSRHIWHGHPAPSRQNIVESLQYIVDQYSYDPNFLNYEQKPVIFFTDVYRVPTLPGESPVDFWANVRQQMDPNYNTLWIAEGLDPSYLAVFDGLYVFKISHANYLHDYVKAPEWASWVRSWEQMTSREKLWIATITPGWNDLNAACRPDVRINNTPHVLDRANGQTYQATFDAAMQSHPDWLIVGSFNEWVEGTYIEPSVLYGDQYLQMTANFVRQFQTP